MSRLSPKDSQELAERKKRKELPHLYGYPWYPWAWKFYTSTNRFNFLCAANQISKSSTQIRKCIDWATDKTKWPTLWPGKNPTQFWYLYPSKPVATTEFYEKWEVEFLPRGKMKDDPVYGWEPEIHNKQIHAIHFNSGISIYFKTYEQEASQLQTGTVYAIFADEELPYELLGELRSRLNATNGYFHMVFTATIGQDEWRRTIEPMSESEELFRGALKLQISMYDCLTYKDGTKSFWTLERIKEIELECATENEVLKRVHGRFIVTHGLRYPTFDRAHNVVKFGHPPPGWHIYSGVDVGSGGEDNHPAAIVFVAVRPDYKFGVVFRGWRGDGVNTASNDILQKHTELLTYEVPSQEGVLIKKQFHPVLQSYDWQARDFFLVSSAAGVGFTPANKKRDSGQNLINTLFKLRMLAIADEDVELTKLTLEIASLKSEEPKSRAKDDLTDAMRYAIMPIPWDFVGVAGEIFKLEEEYVDTRTEAEKAFQDRTTGRVPEEHQGPDIEAELAEWQGYVDG